jgi:hypothetical protein
MFRHFTWMRLFRLHAGPDLAEFLKPPEGASSDHLMEILDRLHEAETQHSGHAIGLAPRTGDRR